MSQKKTITNVEDDGYYWARYKDHGWVLIMVWRDKDNEIWANRLNYYSEPISFTDFGKYQDLRKIEEPEFYS